MASVPCRVKPGQIYQSNDVRDRKIGPLVRRVRVLDYSRFQGRWLVEDVDTGRRCYVLEKRLRQADQAPVQRDYVLVEDPS